MFLSLSLLLLLLNYVACLLLLTFLVRLQAKTSKQASKERERLSQLSDFSPAGSRRISVQSKTWLIKLPSMICSSNCCFLSLSLSFSRHDCFGCLCSTANHHSSSSSSSSRTSGRPHLKFCCVDSSKLSCCCLFSLSVCVSFFQSQSRQRRMRGLHKVSAHTFMPLDTCACFIEASKVSAHTLMKP